MYISKDDFTDEVIETVREALGPDYHLAFYEVVNCWGKMCYGLLACKACDGNTINLNDAYNLYRRGICIPDLCKMITASLKEGTQLKTSKH